MTRPADSAPRGAYFYFDALRFVAALLVVLEHARDLLWLTREEAGAAGPLWQAVYFLTGFGHEAVMIFFVLSGFWISQAIERRKDNPAFWRDYLIDRLSRLMIVIVPALIIGGLLDAWGALILKSPYHLGQSGALSLTANVMPNLTVEAFLGNLLFLQSLAVPVFGSNGPLWSLANEFWYYIWFPALVFLLRQRRFIPALASLGVGLIWPSLLPGFVIWLTGAGLFYADRKWRAQTRPSASRRAGLALLAAALPLLLLAMGVSRLAILPPVASDGAVGLSFALLVWAILRVDPGPVAVLRPVARFGAEASYSLYVIHFPALVALVAWFAVSGRIAPSPMALLQLVGLIVAMLGYAWLFAGLTERRTPRLRTWLRSTLPRRTSGG